MKIHTIIPIIIGLTLCLTNCATYDNIQDEIYEDINIITKQEIIKNTTVILPTLLQDITE